MNSRRVHSITSSARARTSRGQFKSKCLGGFEVDDKFEFGRLHDRQIAYLVAFENPRHVKARLPVALGEVRAIAHQSAGLGECALLIYRRDGVARSERNNTISSAVEERVGPDKHGTRSRSGDRPKRCIEFAVTTSVEYFDLLPEYMCCRAQVPQLTIGIGEIRVDKCSNHLGLRNYLA